MIPIPIFDSLTHPTLSGEWIQPNAGAIATLQRLEMEMAQSDVRWAFAVGMKEIGRYDRQKYAAFIRDSSAQLFPVAYYDFDSCESVASIMQQITEIKRLGYVGIKLHLRFSHIRLTDPLLPTVVQAASQAGLAVFLCTYRHCGDFRDHPNSIDDFMILLQRVADCRLILLHGGTVNLLEMMEIARSFENVLLDLSFTLLKYEGSSLDLDIRHLFACFDRRICVGSDHPQYGPGELRRRWNFFAEGLSVEKAKNIAFHNLASFTQVKIDH